MPIEGLLGLIRKHFSPSEGQILVSSLQQDPLVWQFAQDEEKSLHYFQNSNLDLNSFQPGYIAAWLINKTLDQPIGDLENSGTPLSEELKIRSNQAYDTAINSGLPPADLLSAGLIALALREKRNEKKNWQGISNETFVNSRLVDSKKLFQLWRTPFACLYSLCTDFDDLVTDFLHSENNRVLLQSVPVIIHTFLANGLPNESLVNQLFNIFVNRSVDFQLEGLKWLETFKRRNLREKIAKSLLDTKKNIDFIASIFSDIELFRTSIPNQDPLEKEVRYSLSEDLNRLGAFYYYSGNEQKSAETYQDASDILKFLEAQSSFQAIKNQKGQTSPSIWMGLMTSIPNSKTAKLYYIQTLIDIGEVEEAKDKLESLADSEEKRLLAFQIEENKQSKEVSPKNLIENYQESNLNTVGNYPSYYVHPARFDATKKLLDSIKTSNDIPAGLKLIDEILKNNYHDPEMVREICNIYESAQNYDKALDLASFLERLEPDDNNHKRVLARLYSKKSRWDDVYNTLQGFIKSTSTPEIIDLERFAEASLKTDRVDMAISVCQNILKRESRNAKALILLGECFFEKGDIIKAIQHMEQVVEMIPEQPDTWLSLAHLWEENGQNDRAFEILHKGVKTLPDEPELLHRLGQVYIIRNSPGEALSYLQKAKNIDPENLEINLDLANAFFQADQYEAAWELLQPFEYSYQQYPKIARLMGHVLLAMGNKSLAEPILLFAAKQFPEDTATVITAANLIIGNYEMRFQDLDQEKIEDFSKILELASDLNPKNTALKCYLADMERLKGNFQKALDGYKALSYDTSAQKTSENWRVDYGLGKTAIALGEYEMGLAALQDASSRQPENLLIIHGLVEGYQSANLKTKADELAQTSLKLAPHDLQNILWYANYKNENNEPEEAIKALKDALHINHDQPEITIWLAKTLITTGSYEEAKSYLINLIADDDNSSENLHQAAYALVRMNELELAISALEKAKQISKSFDPFNLLDLSSAYLLIKEPKKALELLNIEQEYLVKYPQIALLKSDILSNLSQYQSAFNTLASLEEIMAEELGKKSEIENRKNRSPLLYTYDFTLSGFYYRMGQLNRALEKFDLANTHLSKALNYGSENDEIKLAKLETLIQSFKVEELQKEFTIKENNEFAKGNLSIDHLDLLCSQAEFLIMNGNLEDAEVIINELSPANRTYPRYLALLSRLSAIHGDLEAAESYYNEANQVYKETLAELHDADLQILFRKLRNIISIAEAAAEQDEIVKAVQFHESAWKMLDNQPLNNWRFSQVLIRAAEDQQKAKHLSIMNHAPGDEVLTENYHKISKILLENLKNYLPEEEYYCLQARMSAAFTGEWPLNLNTDFCLREPENAVSTLISSQDENLIEKALTTYPNNPDVLQAYGIYALKNKKNDGENFVIKALEHDTCNPMNHALLAMLQKNDPEQAIKSINTALQFWPDEYEWHAYAADLHQQIGEHDLAKQHIAKAIEYQPENANYWRRSAEINLQTNDLAHAKHDLEKSASLSSSNSDVWIRMSEVNRRLGFVNEATENIHQASNLKPDDKKIALREAKFLFETKQYQKAEVIAEEVVRRENNNDDARILLAKSQARQGKFDQAMETLSKAAEKSPENSQIGLEILKIRKDKEGIDSVLPDLIKLAQNEPENAAVLTTLTDWLIRTNRLKKAEETAQTILKIMPEEASVHLMLGRLQRKNGQLDQAISHFSDAITLNPNMIAAYIEMGKTYQDRREIEKALEIYQKASEIDASDPEPYFQAGMALKDCKDYPGAEAMLKQAKKYSPNDANIVRQLGMVTALNLINNLREAS